MTVDTGVNNLTRHYFTTYDSLAIPQKLESVLVHVWSQVT